jgi:poly(3-hydroxybutyrate) depolymerase
MLLPRLRTCFVLLLLSTTALADEPALPNEALVLPPVGRYGRSPIPTDALVEGMAAGKWSAPKAGDTVKPANGPERKWEAVPFRDGSVAHRALGGGYAFFPVESDAERVVILEAAGHTMVYANGEPRVGDIYQTGYVRVPILLRKGTNELLFHVARGQLGAKLTTPKQSALLNLADVTAPDLPLGKEVNVEAAVLVLNASKDAVNTLAIEATLPDGKPERTPVPSLTPLTTRKVGFRLRGTTPAKEGPCEVQLRLLRRDGDSWAEVDAAKLGLQTVKPEATQKRTFRSAIDGSVQYYAVVPAKPNKDDKPGLVLTLHGASVEALGQAASYAPKTGLHIVAPTNRRPFGFDWEDWGRLDALEVLAVAGKELGTDPKRTYLTGHSMGGHGSWHLGVTYPDRFAAVAPSAGWVSMWSYAGATRAATPSGVDELLMRAANASDTLALARNLAMPAVYVLHGDGDDNVPVSQARTMRQTLAEFHGDFAYHEEPGVGHWWGKEGVSGAACVDWPPIFEMFARRTLPERAAVRQVEFRTASPGVSARCQWVTVEAQMKPMQVSTVKLRHDAGRRRFTGTTENVARLSLDVAHLKADEQIEVELDGQKLDPKKGMQLYFTRSGEKWSASDPPGPELKNSARCGPFKEAFRNRMVFVYGTRGNAEENAWSLAKARYDAEQFWYRGNGSVDVVADTAFDANAERDRNAIVYGNADTNGAWKALLGDSPIQVRRGSVKAGERAEKGDLACLLVRPRPGSDRAQVAAVAVTGVGGGRLAERLPYFVSGVGYPDWLVLGPSEVRGAGYFGVDWKLEGGESAWRK